MEFTLLAAAVASVGTVLVFLKLQARARPDPIDHLPDRALGAIIVGLVVGRLAAMVVSGTNPISHPADVIIVRAGVSSLAATTAALGYLAISTRSKFGPVVDALAPAALAGLAVWHGSCVLRGSCLGSATSLPWGLAVPGSVVGRHPVELYAAAALAGGALLVWWLRDRSWVARHTGLTAALALGLGSLARLGTEPLRPTFGAGLVAWYAAGVVLGAIIAVVVVLRPKLAYGGGAAPTTGE